MAHNKTVLRHLLQLLDRNGVSALNERLQFQFAGYLVSDRLYHLGLPQVKRSTLAAAKTADGTVAKTLMLSPFSIVVMGRAHMDFSWFSSLPPRTLFVTRHKRRIQYTV